ncbi:MAG TPA: ATP-binding protein [Candidatus Limnocylindrales bacterium]|nr:ATP-binding protein [Candidatus Limnocylindrales bacterium]
MTDPTAPMESDSMARRSSAASQLIIDIASAAAGERDLDQILHETLDRLSSIAPLTGGSIALVEGDDLVVRAAIGRFAEEALGQRLRRGPSASWSVVETLEPRLISDMHREGLRVQGAPSQEAIRSWLAVPIVRRGQGIGLLEIDSVLPHAFSEADLEILEAIVRILSGPVELADHYAAERRAYELRDAFIGVVSHELRTPITTIYGLSKMLRQRGETLDPAVRTRAIEDVEAEADRLHRLVEDLLVLSRAERGAVEIEGEPLGLPRILRRVVEAERSRLANRRLRLEVAEDLPLAVGEETYVEQVVRNLVTNAAKYSESPAPIRIVAERAETEIVIRVLDEGIGIDADEIGRAFDLFFRSPSASRIASGAGIGLFVCRQLVEAMGGRIWVEPRPERGTEVGFTLPVNPDDGDEEPGPG